MSARTKKDSLAEKIGRLGPHERAIVIECLDRLLGGQNVYGEWEPNDGRDMVTEALEEVLDLSQYIAAKLVEIRKGERYGKFSENVEKENPEGEGHPRACPSGCPGTRT